MTKCFLYLLYVRSVFYFAYISKSISTASAINKSSEFLYCFKAVSVSFTQVYLAQDTQTSEVHV